MLAELISVIERRPSLGWVGSASSAIGSWIAHSFTVTFGAIPAVPENLMSWLALAGAFCAVVGGLFTAMIQVRNWFRPKSPEYRRPTWGRNPKPPR